MQRTTPHRSIMWGDSLRYFRQRISTARAPFHNQI